MCVSRNTEGWGCAKIRKAERKQLALCLSYCCAQRWQTKSMDCVSSSSHAQQLSREAITDSKRELCKKGEQICKMLCFTAFYLSVGWCYDTSSAGVNAVTTSWQTSGDVYLTLSFPSSPWSIFWFHFRCFRQCYFLLQPFSAKKALKSPLYATTSAANDRQLKLLTDWWTQSCI